MSRRDDSPSEDRRIRRERTSYRIAPYRKDSNDSIESFRRTGVCKNCKRPGHFSKDCLNAGTCNNCGLPGHIAVECTAEQVCWNCRKPGHSSKECQNEAVCHTCGRAGHLARNCTTQPSPGDARLCNNCYKPGHIAAECTNEKACNKCRQTGHLARNCDRDPVCNICNIAGHVARACPRAEALGEKGGTTGTGGTDLPRRSGAEYWAMAGGAGRESRDLGYMSRSYVTGPTITCQTCGGWGHFSFECPTGRYIGSGGRRY